MPSIVDHASTPGYTPGAARNGQMQPQDTVLRNGQRVSAPVAARPMFVQPPKPDYVFTGLNSFVIQAAKRAGFGATNEEASLLAKVQNEWFFKQAANAISNGSVHSNPDLIKANIDRARRLQATLRYLIEGIDDAIADREPKQSEPHLVVTPEEATAQPEHIETSERQPEITEHGTKHVRPSKSGKLGSVVQ